MDRVGHGARVAAVRLRYALPFAFGVRRCAGFEFSALLLGLIPLAFASAIVRYRLMDVEVIIKRALVYAAALAAIAAIYAVLLRIAGRFLPRATSESVIALLAVRRGAAVAAARTRSRPGSTASTTGTATTGFRWSASRKKIAPASAAAPRRSPRSPRARRIHERALDDHLDVHQAIRTIADANASGMSPAAAR